MISERLQSAINLRDSGRVPDAKAELQAIVNQTNDLNEKIHALGSLAVCHYLIGSLSDARMAWQQAAKVASSVLDAQRYIVFLDACLLSEEGKVEEASAKLKQLLHDYADDLHSPENRELYEDIRQRLAYVLIKLERWQEARPLLEEALTFDVPVVEKSTILCNLGDCCIMADDYEAAKRYYESAREMGIPKGWEARCHYYLGIAYAKLDSFHEAKQELGICESNLADYGLRPNELYGWLAFVSKQLGELEKAREYKKLSLIA